MKWSQTHCASILVDTFSAGKKNALRVEVAGNEIVVRKPGTALLLAYSKSAELPKLVLTRSSR